MRRATRRHAGREALKMFTPKCKGTLLAQDDIERCVLCDHKLGCREATKARVSNETDEKMRKILDEARRLSSRRG